ncbi:MAG: AAA family ATPase [Thermodesulfobacteriota bacterium]
MQMQKESTDTTPQPIEVSGRVLTLTVGLPASGKTYWALSAGFDRAISLDDCRRALWGSRAIQDGPGGIAALLAVEYEQIRSAMAQGKSIVVHNTHFLKAHRTPVIEMARQSGYRTQIVYFDVSLQQCLRRNQNRSEAAQVPEEVIKDFAEQMEPPEAGEADMVIAYSTIARNEAVSGTDSIAPEQKPSVR